MEKVPEVAWSARRSDMRALTAPASARPAIDAARDYMAAGQPQPRDDVSMLPMFNGADVIFRNVPCRSRGSARRSLLKDAKTLAKTWSSNAGVETRRGGEAIAQALGRGQDEKSGDDIMD